MTVKVEIQEDRLIIGGWTLRINNPGNDLALVSHPTLGGAGIWKEGVPGRRIPEELFFAFVHDLLVQANILEDTNEAV
ncbi:hypothetical protein [Stenotrophomonas phage BUCT608]|nr:hypothetical protein [Stenotrophomonas phage BUCT608]QYC97412.1 hypothetical protein [Stenotrophomonas phage BUCT608]